MSEERKEEKQKRGFALMDPEKRREHGRAGGQKAQKTGKAYRFTTDTAKAAGKKGGRPAAKKEEGGTDE